MRPGLVRILGLFVLAATLAALFLWWTSDRRLVLQAFEELQRQLGKSAPEGTLDRLAHARGVAAVFADGFLILAQPYEGSIEDRQQLMAIVDRYRESAERITVSDSDVEITLRPNATADMTSVVEAVGDRPGGPGRERLRIRVAWRKDAGEWRIQELEVLEVLDRSGLFF